MFMTKNKERHNRSGRMDDGTPNPVDLHIGKRIRLRRELQKLNQKALAEKLGLSYQQVQKYELGISRVVASRLWDISKVLDVSLSYFFEEMDEKTLSNSPRKRNNNDSSPDEPLQPRLLDKEESLQLLKAYYKLSDDVRKDLYNLIIKLSKHPAYPYAKKQMMNVIAS